MGGGGGEGVEERQKAREMAREWAVGPRIVGRQRESGLCEKCGPMCVHA